jgi:hypothetical protein
MVSMVQLGHYACFSAGLILLYLATLLYPDEQNRLHNRLEDWWVKLAVTGDGLGAKASSLARAIAERVATFVEPIVPIRGIRGSTIWNALFVTLAGPELIYIHPLPIPIAMGTATLAAAFIPLATSFHRWVRWAVIFFALFVLLPLGILYLYASSFDVPWALLAMPLGSALYLIALVVLIRFLRSSVEGQTRARRLISVLFLVVYSGALLSLPHYFEAPVYFLAARGIRPHVLTGMWFTLEDVAVVGRFSAWPLALWGLSVSLFAIHRLLWSATARVVFALWNFGILKNRRLLAALGVALVGIGPWPFLARLVEWVFLRLK